ncbi:MAG: hypothetical protein HOM21_00380 [Halobacteriovoraceae bacterium]|nr:hypothetical protein [Halobacteriovoraceae bacterium]
MALFLVLLLPSSFASSGTARMGLFSGRISKTNEKAEIVRIKVDFTNQKYLNKRDKVEFWDERTDHRRCKGYIVGKSADYLLLKVPEYIFCKRKINISPGVYVKFFSQDLINNIKMGTELTKILLKKRLAITGKMKTEEKELDSHIEKVNAVNERYRILRSKMEAEWRNGLAALEEDRTSTLRNYKGLQMRLDQLNFKLERYRVNDQNFKTDRWALDPRLYFRK